MNKQITKIEKEIDIVRGPQKKTFQEFKIADEALDRQNEGEFRLLISGIDKIMSLASKYIRLEKRRRKLESLLRSS